MHVIPCLLFLYIFSTKWLCCNLVPYRVPASKIGAPPSFSRRFGFPRVFLRLASRAPLCQRECTRSVSLTIVSAPCAC